MTEEAKALADAQSAEAVQAASVHAEAIEKARAAQSVLADERTARLFKEALEDVFSASAQSGRFIDISRIPLICQAILTIDDSLKNINEKLDTKYVTKEAFTPVQRVVYGVVGLILTSVFVALLSLVITHK